MLSIQYNRVWVIMQRAKWKISVSRCTKLLETCLKALTAATAAKGRKVLTCCGLLPTLGNGFVTFSDLIDFLFCLDQGMMCCFFKSFTLFQVAKQVLVKLFFLVFEACNQDRWLVKLNQKDVFSHLSHDLIWRMIMFSKRIRIFSFINWI